MKTTGVKDISKFGLLVFLGHPRLSNVHSSYRHVEYIGQLLTEQMNDEVDDE